MSSLPDICHIIGLGQSNEQGAMAQPIVTTSDPLFGGYKFSMGVGTYSLFVNKGLPLLRPSSNFTFVTMVSAVFEAYTGETVGPALTSSLKAGRFALGDRTGSPHFLYSFPHQGGKHLVELDYQDYETNGNNPNPGPGGYQATFKDDILRAKTQAATLGKTYGVLAFHFTQGENEGTGYLYPSRTPVFMSYSTFVPAYQAELSAALDHWQSDANLVNPQPRKIPLFIRQVNNFWAGQSQVLLASAREDVYVVGPDYYVPSSANTRWNNNVVRGAPIHMSADGQRWTGEMSAKVMRRVLFENVDWKPLQPISVTRMTDTSIKLKFNVPYRPIQLLTSWLPKAYNYGFNVFLGSMDAPGAQLTIRYVKVTDEDELTVTLDFTTPVIAGANAYVTYGAYAYLDQASTVQPLVAVRSGAPYYAIDNTTGNNVAIPTTELVFNTDISSTFNDAMKEGCCVVFDALTSASILIYDVRVVNNQTIARGDAANGPSGPYAGIIPAGSNLTIGRPLQIMRDRPFGNLCDSDAELSTFSWADSTYGTRAGHKYPLNNFCVHFTSAIAT